MTFDIVYDVNLQLIWVVQPGHVTTQPKTSTTKDCEENLTNIPTYLY